MPNAFEWSPPADWTRVRTVDAHAEGEPLRVILDGWPEVPGDTMLDRRRHAREHHDRLRRALMWEPRGHADMYGALVLPPASDDGDLGVLFLHNEGFSTMCGHGVIGLATVAVQTGLVEASGPETTIRMDTPAGRVTATAHVGDDGRVGRVRFRNVPSFVAARARSVDVERIGSVRYDLAFGGAFYAYVEADAVGLALRSDAYGDIIDAGRAIKAAVQARGGIEHPLEQDLGFLYGTIFVGPGVGDGSHSRNVCVFADGEVDRSPTGTGVSGRAAIHHARGELGLDEWIRIESLIGSTFRVRVLEETRLGPFDAVVPEVEGTAHVTGRNELLIDPEDPLGEGFLLR